MKTRSLIIAAFVLGLLAGTLYWSNRREAAKAAAGGTAEAPRILTLNQADITRVTILRNRTQKITLAKVKVDPSDWEVAETPPLPGDLGVIFRVLSAFSALNSERIIEEKPADLAPYGLAPPVLEAEVSTKDGNTSKFLFGDDTPTGAGTFAMLAGDPRLFTISSYVKAILDKAPADFADKRLFVFGFDFPQKVDMRIGAKSYNITFAADEWKLDRTRMDATSMQSVIARIRDLEGTRFVAGGFGKPVIEITVTASDGKRVERVALSKSGSDYIGRYEGRPALYVVSSTLVTDLEKYVGEMKVYVPPTPEPATSAAPAAPPVPAPPAK